MILKYEIKKIFCKKVNLIAMLVGYVIMAITVILPILNESNYVYQTDTSYQGIDAIQYQQEFAAKQAEYLTEEYLTEVLTQLQERRLDLESDEGFLTASDEMEELFTYLVNSYRPMLEQEFNANLLNELDLSQGAMFYEQRIRKISDFLNADFSYGDYTEAEKTYWLAKAEEVSTPFRWGDKTVVDFYRTVLGLGFYLMFVVIVCIAPVFAGENESGAAGILLASKHGKGKMVYAKILASLVFSISYVGIGYILSCLGTYMMIGIDGLDLPVQLLANEIPYEMNMAQLLLLQLLVSFAMTILTIGLILLISAFTKSSMGTMAIMLLLLVGPAFLEFSRESSLYNHLLALTTVRLLDVKECLRKFIDYRIGNVVIGVVPFSIAVHILLGAVSLVLCKTVFVRRSVTQ